MAGKGRAKPITWLSDRDSGRNDNRNCDRDADKESL